MTRTSSLFFGTILVLVGPILVPALAATSATTETLKKEEVLLVDERPAGKLYTFIVDNVADLAATQSIQKKTCAEGGYTSCFVSIIDPALKLGQITITARPGQIVDANKLRAQVKNSGFIIR